jgi:hypothetical protein
MAKILGKEGNKMNTDFSMLKITIDVTEYPGSLLHTYKQLYLTREFVENATMFDVMEVVTKAAEEVMRKRLVEP